MKREIVDVIEQKRLNEAREQKDSLLALLRESRMHFFNCAKLRDHGIIVAVEMTGKLAILLVFPTALFRSRTAGKSHMLLNV